MYEEYPKSLVKGRCVKLRSISHICLLLKACHTATRKQTPTCTTLLTACLSACAFAAALRELLISGRCRRRPVRVHTYPFSRADLKQHSGR